MDRGEFTWWMLIFTGAVFALAIVVGLLLLCGMRCCYRRDGDASTPSRRKRTKKPKECSVKCSSSKNPLVQSSHSGAGLSVDIPDLDYIDEKNTSDLISSTIQISSLHNSPRH